MGKESAMWDVFHIKRPESKGGKVAYWTKIGIAFANRDGSFNLDLDFIPRDFKLHMRPKKVAEAIAMSSLTFMP